MAFLAYYLHWPRAELMGLAHRERRDWCAEVSDINRQLDGASAPGRPIDSGSL